MAVEQAVPGGGELAAARRAAEAEVLIAAETFGRALRASPEFTRLALAGDALSADAEARAAIDAFQSRQADLRLAVIFGALSDAEATDLERLQAAMLGCPSVAAYLEAQTTFQAICRETAAVLSGQIDTDFAANCRAGGCCGG